MRRIATPTVLLAMMMLGGCTTVRGDDITRSPYALPCAGPTTPGQCLEAARVWNEGDHPRPNAPMSEGLAKTQADIVRRERSHPR
jgi:predicted small secreted protein